MQHGASVVESNYHCGRAIGPNSKITFLIFRGAIRREEIKAVCERQRKERQQRERERAGSAKEMEAGLLFVC